MTNCYSLRKILPDIPHPYTTGSRLPTLPNFNNHTYALKRIETPHGPIPCGLSPFPRGLAHTWHPKRLGDPHGPAHVAWRGPPFGRLIGIPYVAHPIHPYRYSARPIRPTSLLMCEPSCASAGMPRASDCCMMNV